MRAGYRRCSILMEPPNPLNFSRYRSKLSLNNRTRCALVTQSCTQNCESIFSKTRSNIPPSLSQSREVERDLTAPLLRLRNDSEIRLRRLPALRITFLCFLVRDRAGDVHIVSRFPVHWCCYLVLRGQL